jgi:HSP20 family protein
MTRTVTVESNLQGRDQAAGRPQETRGEATRSRPVFRPDVDIVETAEELLLLADVPGARADDVSVHFEQGVLTLHARVPERRPAQARPLVQEYGVGDFERSFQVSEAIDAEKIHAELDAGVLTVHLPKVEALRPRQIRVQAR